MPPSCPPRVKGLWVEVNARPGTCKSKIQGTVIVIKPSHYRVRCTSDTQANNKKINEDTHPYIDQHKIDKSRSAPAQTGHQRRSRDRPETGLNSCCLTELHHLAKNISIYLTYIQFLHRLQGYMDTNVWINVGVEGGGQCHFPQCWWIFRRHFKKSCILFQD